MSSDVERACVLEATHYLRELQRDLRGLVECQDVSDTVWIQRACEVAALGADLLQRVEDQLLGAMSG